MPQNPDLTAVDLFSGAGGTSLGLQQAGFRVVAAVEKNPLAVESYRMNFHDVTVFERDIQTVRPAELMRLASMKPGDLSLLAACPPCQGFSSIRTLNGSRQVEDYRNGLLKRVIAFVRVLRPLTVMIENVPGLEPETTFAHFVSTLKLLGFYSRHMVADASRYGVPQRRRRLLLLSSRLGRPPLEHPDSNHRTVRDTLRGLPKPGKSGDPLHDHGESRTDRVAALIRRIPMDGGSRSDLGEENQLLCHTKTDGFRDIYGRMAWDRVAPTITCGCISPSKGRFLHPEQHRAITLREAALLQSFPKTFKISLKRGKHAAAEMIGNALPPEFVKRHALALKQHLLDPNGEKK